MFVFLSCCLSEAPTLSLLQYRINFMAEDDDTIDPHIIANFARALEKHLFEELIMNCQPKHDQPADRGLNLVYVHDPYKPSPKLTTNPVKNPDLTMNFCGSIQTTRSKGALPVTEAFGITFYMVPEGFASLSKATFVPAWLVPAIKDKQGSSMMVLTRKGLFSHHYTKYLKNVELTAILNIFYLVLRPEVKSFDEDVLLSRNLIDAEVQKMEVIKAPKAKKKAAGAKGKGKGAKYDSQWRELTHMLK